MEESPKLMTLREVAEYLRLNVQTVYRLAQQGKIPAFKVGGAWRFDAASVEAWIAERRRRARRSPGSAPAEQGSSCILVVDDDPAVLQMVATCLREAGYGAVTASSGLEALDVAAREQPQLVLLDLGMPEIDGLEVMRRMRSDPRLATLPIVFLARRTESEAKLQAVRASGHDCLVKPFSRNELEARVQRHLRWVGGE